MVSVQRLSFLFLFYSDILGFGIYFFHMAEKEHISSWGIGEKKKKTHDLCNARSCLSFLIALQETDVTTATFCQGERER